jgi:hypothetical protein
MPTASLQRVRTASIVSAQGHLSEFETATAYVGRHWEKQTSGVVASLRGGLHETENLSIDDS